MKRSQTSDRKRPFREVVTRIGLSDSFDRPHQGFGSWWHRPLRDPTLEHQRLRPHLPRSRTGFGYRLLRPYSDRTWTSDTCDPGRTVTPNGLRVTTRLTGHPYTWPNLGGVTPISNGGPWPCPDPRTKRPWSDLSPQYSQTNHDPEWHQLENNNRFHFRMGVKGEKRCRSVIERVTTQPSSHYTNYIFTGKMGKVT